MGIDRKNFVFKPGLKLPIIDDVRTIPLRMLLKLKLLPDLPAGWDAHEAVGGVQDNFMFGNDEYGDCVKAMMAHAVLTFEKYEGGEQIVITTDEVVQEYLRETGGADSGLYLTYAMKDWRNHGLTFDGKIYKIHAFAGVDTLSHGQIKYCIYLLRGIMLGMQVFSTDIDQFRRGEPWYLTGSNGTYEGGHGIYGFKYNDSDNIKFINSLNELDHQGIGYFKAPNMSKVLSYNDYGMTVMTWGEKQFGDWDFWDARLNQAFGVVDDKNKWTGPDSPIDVELMESQLNEITGNGEEPSECPFANAICRVLDKGSQILGRKSRFKTVIQ